jgi:hypothetical protein
MLSVRLGWRYGADERGKYAGDANKQGGKYPGNAIGCAMNILRYLF